MTSTEPSEISDNTSVPLRGQVRSALQDYLRRLDGDMPSNLYKFVLREIEPPLLEEVMRYTGDNQTKAAAALGINRSTLRKKLKQYGIG